ncbi:MAG: ATP-dependent Clp protease ATP-binding subunit ClpX, partial [Deltaproteobacteria bacterium]|nr:ATP-dependent Clp protease ATP-binding subunit ClpX [Deltaproteobacteria bacterium]
VARESMRRKAGARGLRAILENVMLDTMYELPSQTNIKECIINEDVIREKARPIIVYGSKAETA